MENRPKRDVTWADVVAKRKSPEKQHRRNNKYERKESENYSTDEQELQRREDRIKRKTRQYKTAKPEEIIGKKKKKTAAISITTRGEITNREIMIKAKREIVLKDYGNENCQIRSGFTGGLVIEIPGEDAESKADRLAIKLKDIFEGDQVRINRPRVKADIKITGLDESTTNEEIQEALSRSGECLSIDIKITARRTTARGNGIVWVQCPLEAANNIIKKKVIIC